MEHQSLQKFATNLLFVGNKCGKAEEAVRFYVSLFKDSRIVNIQHYAKGNPLGEKGGNVQRASFILSGQEFIAQDSSNQGHNFTFTPATSTLIYCDTEEEINKLYEELSNRGEILMPLNSYVPGQKFGWVNDKFGVSWQLHLRKG